MFEFDKRDLETRNELKRIIKGVLDRVDLDAAITADNGESGKPVANSVSMLETARRILLCRSLRNETFNPAMFGEPAWEMLLNLYVSEFEGARFSVGSLGIAAGAPATTALRWLVYLEKERFVSREPNPTDGRSEIVFLADRGRSAMEEYLIGTRESLP